MTSFRHVKGRPPRVTYIVFFQKDTFMTYMHMHMSHVHAHVHVHVHVHVRLLVVPVVGTSVNNGPTHPLNSLYLGVCLLCIHIALLLSRITACERSLMSLAAALTDFLYVSTPCTVMSLHVSIFLCAVALLRLSLVSEASCRSLLLVRISCSRPHPSFAASFSVPFQNALDIDRGPNHACM